jgi:predicted ATPase/DNA-binding CsgD family transcriptional regulator
MWGSVTRAERGQAAGHTTGIWTPLTRFVGRAQDAAELKRLLERHRLVTVTGPGGVGKTRLAAEVARQMTDSFPDGTWFVGLGAVTDPAQVTAEVSAALSVPQDPERPALQVLADALAPRRLLLVLDNCEHVLGAVAAACNAILGTAEEVRVLVTSREQLGMGGETRYRLSPLELPTSAEQAAVVRSAACELFAERAAQADPRFTVGPERAALVARVVARLDGMPLAIELAAARVEALGLAGLADRIDDALRLLTGRDQLAAARHRSLAAVADWSYQLLTEAEQRVFRRLAVFPGPFTLEAAEAVAGRDAGPAVLRLVDCSLLVPPRLGADQRTRYTMLQTLHDYALDRLREAGEEADTTAALAAFAWTVAEQAKAGLETTDGEPGALRWLDAEDATLSRAQAWALDHDPEAGLRMANVTTRWLRIRGRLVEAQLRLSAAVARCSPDAEGWAMAHVWLGYLLSTSPDASSSFDCLTAACDAYRGRRPSPVLVEALIGRAVIRLNMGHAPAEVDDARRALRLARELGYLAGEIQSLTALSLTAYYADNRAEVLDWARQAQKLMPADIPGDMLRWSYYILATVLAEIGEYEAARPVCEAGLARSHQADDQVHLVSLLGIMANLQLMAGSRAAAAANLREAVGIAVRIGDHVNLTNLIQECGFLCAVTGRWADAVSLWAAHAADRERRGLPASEGPVNDGRRSESMREIERALSPAELREAHQRGSRMPVPVAAELALMVTTAAERQLEGPPPTKVLSPRERELVTLVAQGRTNAEIAAQLYISVRTVSSHLDRIRDKTGCRRRADLTRLALEESLV